MPLTKPSITAICRSTPVNSQKKAIVQPMVAIPSSSARGSPKSGSPGRPVIRNALTFTRFTPTITIIVPMTSAGKNFSSRVKTGRAMR